MGHLPDPLTSTKPARPAISSPSTAATVHHARPALIDSHVHIDDERLRDDLPSVLEAARRVGIIAQIVPAISRQLWPRVQAVCNGETDLFACYGLHPCFFADHAEGDIAELAVWLSRERPVGVGECGLDYMIAGADKAQQQALFDAQLALAREFDLPVVVHARKAVEDVIRMIRASGHYSGLIHSFNGSLQQAHRLIDLGYKVSFGGAVTYSRAKKLQELVKRLPLDALLLETDAPDQVSAQQASKRNEPQYLLDVWRTVTQLREEDAATIAEATTQNAIDLFKLPLHLTKHPVEELEGAST